MHKMTESSAPHTENKVALVTGAAKRLGKAIAEKLHSMKYNIVVHFEKSKTDALLLVDDFNRRRADSAIAIQANLADFAQLQQLTGQTIATWGRVDLLVNNASVFVPDNKGPDMADQIYQDNFAINSQAPYRLARLLQNELTRSQGQIINMVDIYADRPLRGHGSYSMSKAANAMLVKSLALELAPSVRVNGIAPGAILWPEPDSEAVSEQHKDRILSKVPLQKLGELDSITRTVQFILECDYLHGQILKIDGGRSLTI